MPTRIEFHLYTKPSAHDPDRTNSKSTLALLRSSLRGSTGGLDSPLFSSAGLHGFPPARLSRPLQMASPSHKNSAGPESFRPAASHTELCALHPGARNPP